MIAKAQRLGRYGLALALAATSRGLWKRDEIRRLVNVLDLFSADKIVHNFSHMDQVFHSRKLASSGTTPSPLPQGPQHDMPAEARDWIAQRDVTGIVVLKDGEVVFEDYYKGTNARDLRINWSISKSYLSALFGVLHGEGVFDSLDDPVTKFASALAGGAYDVASIKDVLQMSSGIRFNEDYLAFFSDINRMGRVLALGGSMDGFATAQKHSDAAPGERWEYVSIDTHVLGMIIRGATGKNVADLMNDRIIKPLGFEVDPYYLTDGFGEAFVLGGLAVTTRDNARFAQMFANGGKWQGKQVVPADWVAASTTPSAKTVPGEIRYGYQWWIPDGSQNGEFLGRGIYGQYIYIDPARKVVISVHAAYRGFREDGVQIEDERIFRRIAASLE
ncbi:MAG: serine hydrolase domain-containing protein [Yoonia sp.]|uniref:serine hydrolase domain-containing protein n=1 Tax=Yoonia sp. TaxID=2212373 RepID=UPI003EF61CFA